MSRLIFFLAVCVAVVGLAGVSFAADDYSVYNSGSQVLSRGGPAVVAFGGPGAPGMRFGDVGHVSGGEGYGGGCPDCGVGVQGAFCDPCWRGPCMDWKQIGWYSHWGHGFHCERKCGNAACGSGGGCAPCGY